uniref:cGMP-dependent protein kinase n=1 Tax=Globisporangium ultimum (strain ATCC 200006 / CBS 805.95 / DAOM BR144) TaxID=431595 RepID=K3X7Z9_GLOUD
MGGGVSKSEYDRIRKELVMKEQVIRTLQEKLQQTPQLMPVMPPAASPPPPKVHRVSFAEPAMAFATSSQRGTTALSPKPPGMTEVDDDDERQPANRNKAKRRIEVSAEVMSKKKILSEKERIVHPKSDASRAMLLKVVQSNVLFTGQTRYETAECLDAFFPTNAAPGAVVIRQGDQGDHFYAIESGQLEILVAVAGSPTPIRYGFLGPGMGFGELALLCNMPRAATIRAVTDVELWALERNTFREISASHKLIRLNRTLEVLQHVPILNKLTHSELHQVAAAMEWEEYEANRTIIRQGEVGEHFYVITTGEIVVTQKDPDTAEETQIRILKPGDHFGEMALFKDETRSATCTALTQVQCLTLGREHFILMLGTIQELMDREPPQADPKRRLSSSMQRKASIDQLDGNASVYKYFMSIPKDELEILQTLGRGAFGRVKLVRHAGSNSAYALKCLVKSRIVENNLKEHVLNEKRVMLALDHPFILKLYSTYKDKKYLYFLVELALGGELFTYLRRKDRFDEHLARFYIASVVLVFQHMHSKSIAYRDLKPENILLDNEGFIKLADFGLAKLVTDRTWTLCGTPDYLAPEIILNKGHDKAVDYWALGILIYELLVGSAPFFAQDPMQVYALIIQGNVKFPVYFGRACVDLIQKLLSQNPARRLGNMKHGIKDIINHKWFAGFPWDGLISKSIKPPIVPQIRDAFDTSNFEDFQHEAEDAGLECDWDPDF